MAKCVANREGTHEGTTLFAGAKASEDEEKLLLETLER
jgi:hypothetical protein|tara:strand:- start:699 stop:812 length:114 start_codon:yes stop_codon:yes gene_type:complete